LDDRIYVMPPLLLLSARRGARHWRSRLLAMSGTYLPIAALLPLARSRWHCSCGNRPVLHGGEGRLSHPVLARRGAVEGALSGRRVLTPLSRREKGRDKVWPAAVGEMCECDAEPAEAFELIS